LSWNNSLATTEKDTVDDLTYFKSYIYQGGELEELKVKAGKEKTKSFNGITNWGAIRTKYFICALIPESPQGIRSASLAGKNENYENYSFSFSFDGYAERTSFTLYLGPLEYDRIKKLDVELEKVMDFGWAFIRPISKGVLFTLKRMHVYIPNYGFVLILFSVLVKILVFPLTKKSYQSTSAMQQLQPEITALREKHKNNPQKLNQATMQLYKEKGVNPLGGCFPMLLQMPLLFALFIVFRTTIELRNEPFVFWIKDSFGPR
jgi:membrane protein insertase, YidC/Oxa1 family, C-terminal domain